MSATTQPRFVKCPTCHKAVAWTAEARFRPFCSDRCKLIDLGEWVMAEKKIAGESLQLSPSVTDTEMYLFQ